MSDNPQSENRDYFAEMYVAGILADNGWNIYFPRRDKGFDFIITKPVRNNELIVRPVQVKGKYPRKGKADEPCYGYVGELSATHDDMVLVAVYFPTERTVAPVHIVYLPFTQIRKRENGDFRCVPAQFKSGKPEPRKDFRKYFDQAGMEYMESPDWGRTV